MGISLRRSRRAPDKERAGADMEWSCITGLFVTAVLFGTHGKDVNEERSRVSNVCIDARVY